MVRKIGTSRRYQSEPGGLRAMTAMLVLREKVVKPLHGRQIQAIKIGFIGRRQGGVRADSAVAHSAAA
jgi:hypothetical protein